MVRGRAVDIPKLILQLFILLFINPWGRVILGLCVFAGGLIWGLNSHQVAYVNVPENQGIYQVFLSDDNSLLIFQQQDTDSYYVMPISNYSPFVDTATIMSEVRASDSFSFIASTDFVQINGTVTQTGAYISQAHPIEKAVFYDAQHQHPLTYVSSDYSGNPDGYTVNNWLYASPLILAGALCVALSLFFERRARERKKLAVQAELAALRARPSPFARELAEGS